MPELPEVNFCARSLARWTAERRVVDIVVADPRAVRARRTDRPSAGRADGAEALAAVARGARPRELLRHGKRLLWRFGAEEPSPDDGALLLHLGMTGKWAREPTPWTKVTLHLDDGTSVHFCDPRLLGGVVPTRWEDGQIALREGLGPDALGPLPPLRGSRAVKLALMDQAVVAGIGNVQAMEALWRARIHPTTRCDDLGARHSTLETAVHAQLAWSIALLGDDDTIVYVEEDRSQNPFPLYRREGEACPVCATPIARMIQGGRSTYWCPSCQRA